jgi:hypothetical protein
MALPTQTWRVSTLPYNITKVVAMTAAEALLGIKNAFDADTGNHWEVAGYDSSTSNGWLMLRRKVSSGPSGVHASFRVLLFGGTVAPNAGAMQTGHSPAVGALNCGICEDAAVDEPDQSPWVGNPFPTKKWAGATRVGAIGTQFSATATGDVVLASCDRMGVIVMRAAGTTDYALSIMFGEIIERADDGVGVWGHIATYGGATAAAKYPASGTALFPALDTSTPASGAWHDGAQVRGLARLDMATSSASQAVPFLSQGGTAILLPAPVVSGAPGSGFSSCSFLGMLRQIRLGPFDSGIRYSRDATNAVQAIFLGGSVNTVGGGLYLTQSP